MNFSLVFQGCPSPIVVKFADTEKEKLQKKMQQMVALGGMGMNIGLGMGFPYFQHANYNAACQQVRRVFELFFVKKIPLSRRDAYVWSMG